MQNENESPPTSTTALRPISDVLNSLLPSASEPKSEGCEQNSSITGKAMVVQKPIGKPPSEIVLGSLRNIAQNMLNGNLVDDKMLEMLLVQHFGQSRFSTGAKLKHKYGKDGYDCEIEGYDVKLDGLSDSEMKLFDALEFLNKPAQPDFIAKNLAKLRIVMARAGESNDDLTLLIHTYAEHLAEFPPDVVKAVCEKIINNNKWFPLVSDMRIEMLRLVKFRRAILESFEMCRNPLLAQQAELKRIAADPRLKLHWKEFPKSKWMAFHYDQAIADMEGMMAMAQEGKTQTPLAEWQAKVDQFKAEKAALKS